jgi:hypothetical protein
VPPTLTLALACGLAVELTFFARVFGEALALRAEVFLRAAFAELRRAVGLAVRLDVFFALRVAFFAVFLLCFFCGREPFAAFALRFFCGRAFAVVFRVRAADRPAAAVFFFAGVAFFPRALLLVADFLVVFFFAILMPLKMVSGFDRWPLTVVSSIAYRNHKRRKYSPPELKYRQKHDRGGLRFAWQQTIRSRTIHKEVARLEPLRDQNAPGRSRLRR